MRARAERQRQEHAAPRDRRARAPTRPGTIAWDGADLAGVPPHRRGFGLMFQDHALFPHRDVLGNVAFGLRMQRLAAADVDDARARDARARRPRRLRAPAGLASSRAASSSASRSPARSRREPAPADARRAARRARPRAARPPRRRAARAVRRGSGSAIVFVTHDHDEAFALADRVVVMHDGRIEQDGSPGRRLAAPGRRVRRPVPRLERHRRRSATDGARRRRRAVRRSTLVAAGAGARRRWSPDGRSAATTTCSTCTSTDGDDVRIAVALGARRARDRRPRPCGAAPRRDGRAARRPTTRLRP